MKNQVGFGFGYGFSGSGRRGALLNQIPFKSDALFWLDGTIQEFEGSKYFVDKSGNDRNFVINDYDFNDNWDKGFPYKSASTISAPVGDAVLIAADINNYLYASDGTPNQIPVVSLFQDIDYEHKLFCRHIPQEVDGNGVEIYEPRVLDIVLYNTALDGDNLTEAQIYYIVPAEETTNVKWVSKTGSDSALGTKSAPWLTIQKANDSANTGDTIYIKSGLYNEIKTATTAEYLQIDKSLNYRGLGFVKVTSNNTTNVVNLLNVNCNFNGIWFFGSNNSTNIIKVNNNKTYTLQRCFISAAKSYLISGGVFERMTLINCVGLGQINAVQSTQYIYITTNTINTNYFKNLILWADKANFTFSNNKFEDNDKQVCLWISSNLIATAIGNYFNYKRNAIASTSAYTGGQVVTIKYNKFRHGAYLGAGGIAIDISGNPNMSIEYNNFISTELYSTNGGTFIKGNNYKILNNIMYSETTLRLYHIFNTGNSVRIEKNYSHSNSLIEAQITTGETSTTGLNDNLVFKNNRIIGAKFNNPYSAGSCHAVLLTSGKNMDIKYNYISHSYIGLVAKSNADAYTANGIQYNLISECSYGIYIRGITGINIFNNIIGNDKIENQISIAADENSAVAGDQFSENVIIKNNIIKSQSGIGVLINFDAHAAANGCIAENNQLFGAQYLLSDGTNYSDLATAQAAGKLLNCVVADPLLSNALIPATPIEGADLGEDYNTGLNVTTIWGSATNAPVIVTKQQAESWQKGAYIQ